MTRRILARPDLESPEEDLRPFLAEELVGSDGAYSLKVLKRPPQGRIPGMGRSVPDVWNEE